MSSDRFLSEITSVRQKYNRAVFDLEKCKEKVVFLETKNKNSIEECDNLKKKIQKYEEENKSISSSLEEAMKKIDTLSLGSTNPQLQSNGVESPQKSGLVSNEQSNGLRAQISELKEQNKKLQARLKQAEFGIEQRKEFTLAEKSGSEEEPGYEVEKLLNHRKKGKTLEFLVRWKNFGAEGDTWEPESNLCCPSNICKELAMYKKKNRI